MYPDWSPKMKDHAGRPCKCGNILRLPTDVIDVSQPGVEESAGDTDAAPKRVRKKYIRAPGEPLIMSTKMKFLHDELMSFSRRNPNSPHYNPFELDADAMEEVDKDGKPFVTKSVIFSQWTTMLDRIGDMLDDAEIKYARLDGTMSREERARAIDDLKNKKRVEVLLVSTRAGGVGLNLTAASRCYLVDPYWNPSVESQAIDRIHRMGQTRPVTAVKLMINNSIEQRLDKIQKKKAQLANVSLNNMSRKELLEKRVSQKQCGSHCADACSRPRSWQSCLDELYSAYSMAYIINRALQFGPDVGPVVTQALVRHSLAQRPFTMPDLPFYPLGHAFLPICIDMERGRLVVSYRRGAYEDRPDVSSTTLRTYDVRP